MKEPTLGTFEIISKHGDHEQVVFCNDPHVGLKAIIAIHNTSLGPALGGTRMWNYKNEDEALVDVLRLSKGMTYKAAASGLNLGGGKAVIIGDPKTQKSEGLFRAFGQFVNSLNGKYITAEDVGTSVQDMEHIYMETPWVTGIPKDFGGSGDPSPYTAHGVLMGIKASAKEKFGTDSLKGIHIAVQGLGNVGSNLVKYLVEEGAVITVADIDMNRTKSVADKFGAKAVSSDDILFTECDILAPCALGAIVNDQTITKLKTKVIAGGANNVLAEARHGDQLKELGILYAPDYVINAGGLMNVFVELEGYSPERAFEKTKRVYDNILKVYEIAKRDGIGTHTAADRLAEERINTIGRLKQRHPGKSSRAFTTLREVHNR
ncbi:Glu/Leu/Phe/Val dehydrogenase [Bdellovibrio bacteriovorus]|uniref:Leucine dehydrogenase n=1 Tax=Bdellovibrio bacteriovorus (strain ATCC 15356 / DSM 50701 / NCIMB 9529 / HD100) TaxID=264462 RepID=Q6MLI1_BDEBA|nr:Glu/Leu/Phe/Val dehydrogenase [Bdellovibrio bacteriovorus]CAE79876.1 leucine dehydrogenase [Bdellovibrio bacteriovorus HD100]